MLKLYCKSYIITTNLYVSIKLYNKSSKPHDGQDTEKYRAKAVKAGENAMAISPCHLFYYN